MAVTLSYVYYCHIDWPMCAALVSVAETATMMIYTLPKDNPQYLCRLPIVYRSLPIKSHETRRSGSILSALFSLNQFSQESTDAHDCQQDGRVGFSNTTTQMAHKLRRRKLPENFNWTLTLLNSLSLRLLSDTKNVANYPLPLGNHLRFDGIRPISCRHEHCKPVCKGKYILTKNIK